MAAHDFSTFPLWLNSIVFLACAAMIWLAGTHLTRDTVALAERTGWGKAFLGAVLLGGITSLPELATTVSASALGNAPLAVNNLVGGVPMQVAVLVLADAAVPGRPLSSLVRGSVPLLEGIVLLLVLVVAGGGILLGDGSVLGLGVATTAILVVSLGGFQLVHRQEANDAWRPVEAPRPEPPAEPRGEGGGTLARLVTRTAAAGAVILVAGYILARTADALAEQTGLGSSFVGAVLVALSTSLPEVSTTLSAVALGQYTTAVSNILGTNILDLAALFVADLVYPGGPVLAEMGGFTLATVLLGMALTAVYLAGLLLRSRRVLGRLGLDSVLVAPLYVGGVYVLYTLR